LLITKSSWENGGKSIFNQFFSQPWHPPDISKPGISNSSYFQGDSKISDFGLIPDLQTVLLIQKKNIETIQIINSHQNFRNLCG
jgi:hypothetical protein